MDSVKKILTRSFRNTYFKLKSNYYKKYDRDFLNGLTETKRLSKNEKIKIVGLWKEEGRVNFDFSTVCKTINGFDERYLSRRLYMTRIGRSLNPKSVITLENKSLYAQLLVNIPQPKTIVKRINGAWIDGQLNFISSIQAIEKLAEIGKFIIKPVSNTNSGQNVHLINHIDIPSIGDRTNKIREMISKVSTDFIAQEVLYQSPITAKFNESSVNTIRVCTLFLNEKITITEAHMRIGKKDSVVDNLEAGGIMVGIHENGELFEYALDKYLNKYYKSHTGAEFKNSYINNIAEIKNLAISCHKLIPHFHYIGWDFAINTEGKTVLIELNASYPEITLPQIIAGPIFGDRTEEVIEFVQKNPAKMHVVF